MNVQHLSKSSLWMSPTEIVEASRELMGGIELDPASDEEANRRVQADRYLRDMSEHPDLDWGVNKSVFLNPPGGRGLPKAFWNKLHAEWRRERTDQAIYIAFSLEQLQQNQSMLDFPVCFPNKRLKYVPREGKAASPTHASAIVYLPPRAGDSEHRFVSKLAVQKFEDIFSKFGKVKL
jgi:hypothetical protein